MTGRLLTPDICVVGAGSGGLSVAAGAAAFGVSVVLVEKGEMGGDCLNTGCVPSKALLAAAKRAALIRTAAPFGIAVAEPQIDFAAVGEHVRETIAGIAPMDSEARFRALGVTVIRAEGRFVDPDTLAAGGATIRARRFVLATGSRPALPRVQGLDTVPFLTNETIFGLRQRPDHLAILGGGPIGLELAQAFRRLGSRVTVIEAAAPLSREDPEAVRIVVESLERDGVTIIAPGKVSRVETERDAIRLGLDAASGETALLASHLLVATGRRPVIEGLGLDAAGIAHGPEGIRLGKDLRTSNRRVYAIGDAAGSWQFTHVANDHAGLVLRAILFRLPVRASTFATPRVTYTDPELAHVGLSEAEAMRRGPVRILRWSFHDNDRARAERIAHGSVKLVTTRRGRLLGATVVGPQAGEMISLFTLALRKRLGVRDLVGIVFPYPTLSEAARRAAIGFYTPSLTNRTLRRILALLRKLG